MHHERKKMSNRGNVIAAATDGACSGNPGPGGWGALLRFEDGSVEEFGGFEPNTTNNRMELQAAISVLNRLKALQRCPELTIRTDSKYLIDGLSKWMANWKRKGWRTAAGKPVLNQDLWQELDRAQLADVSLEYVKGHSGDPDNDRVDEIAVSYSKRMGIKLKSFRSFENENTSHLTKETALENPCPANFQKLISRLDMANHLATKGYSLSIDELSQLVEKPKKEIEKETSEWEWRDWVIEPMSNSRWRFRHYRQGATKPIGKDND